jgi:hypothetical protein
MDFKYFSSLNVLPSPGYPNVAELMQQNIMLVQQLNTLINEN